MGSRLSNHFSTQKSTALPKKNYGGKEGRSKSSKKEESNHSKKSQKEKIQIDRLLSPSLLNPSENIAHTYSFDI